MPYDPNDPNQDSQTDTGRSSGALQGQLENLNHLLATWQITPQQAQQMMPPNTKFDPSSGHFVVNDPMNPWPIIIALSAPLALGWGGGAAGGGAGVVGAAGNEGDAAALAGGTAVTGVPAATAATSGAATAAASGLPDWLKVAGDVGSALGAASAGAASGRNADNNANIGFAQAQNQLYNSELAAPGKIAGNAVRGDILSNARDVSIAAPSDIPQPTISGGLRPSMFSDTTRQLGKNITANAAATPMLVATPPTLQPFETGGVGSDILNTAGVIGSLAKSIPPSLYPKIAGLFQ